MVSGGSRGLGEEMVLALARRGLDVVLTYHSNEDRAAEVVTRVRALGRKAFALPLDTSKTGGFDQFFALLSERLQQEMGRGRFDYLINNAGTGLSAPFETTTEEQFDAMMDIHLKGVFFLTQKALPHLNDGGGIINISSGLARFSIPNMSAYASMKGAVEVFTRYLSKELAGRGIRANVVAPGAIGTDFNGGGNRDVPAQREAVSKLTALGRVGNPDDVGPVVAFLCSPDAKWITAQRIEVSGGMMI